MQTQPPSPEPKRKRRRRWIVLPGLILVLGLGGAALWWWLNRSDYRPLGTHPSVARAVAISPDGQTLYSASLHESKNPGAFVAWDVARGREVQRMPANMWFSQSPDGEITAIHAPNRDRIELWRTKNWAFIKSISGPPERFIWSALSPDGRVLASAGGNLSGVVDDTAELWLWDLAEDKPPRQLVGHTSLLGGVAFSPDGKVLATTGGYDKSVRLWDVASGQAVAVLTDEDKDNRRGSMDRLAFSFDGKYLAACSINATMVWDVATRKLVAELQTKAFGSVYGLAFAPDSSLLAVGGGYLEWKYFHRGQVGFWRTRDWKFLGTEQGFPSFVLGLAFSPDGTLLGTAGVGGHVGLMPVPAKYRE